MESKTENRKWKNAGRFPAELLFMTGFFAGNVLPNLIWKMEWKQKTLASFYLIRSFAGKDISGGAYFLEVLRRRGGFFLLLFLCGFTIFGVPLTVAYMLFFGNGDRNDSGIIGSGIWYLWRCGRRRTSDAAVSGLYSGVFLSCRYRIQTIVWDLEKLWTCAAENRGLFSAGDHSFSAVYRRNPRRKFSESLDRRKSYKGPEIFLRKISTISSDGFHKICDIWWFVPESVEIVRFYDEKLFDFM